MLGGPELGLKVLRIFGRRLSLILYLRLKFSASHVAIAHSLTFPLAKRNDGAAACRQSNLNLDIGQL